MINRLGESQHQIPKPKVAHSKVIPQGIELERPLLSRLKF